MIRVQANRGIFNAGFPCKEKVIHCYTLILKRYFYIWTSFLKVMKLQEWFINNSCNFVVKLSLLQFPYFWREGQFLIWFDSYHLIFFSCCQGLFIYIYIYMYNVHIYNIYVLFKSWFKLIICSNPKKTFFVNYISLDS